MAKIGDILENQHGDFIFMLRLCLVSGTVIKHKIFYGASVLIKEESVLVRIYSVIPPKQYLRQMMDEKMAIINKAHEIMVKERTAARSLSLAPLRSSS